MYRVHVVAQRHGRSPARRAPRSTCRRPGNGDRGDTHQGDATATDPQNHASDDGLRHAPRSAPPRRPPARVKVKPTAPAVSDTVSAVVTGFADARRRRAELPVPVVAQRQRDPRANGPQPRPVQAAPARRPATCVKVDVKALDGHGGTSPAACGSTTVVAGNGHPVAVLRLRGGRGHRRRRPVRRQRRHDHRRHPRRQRPVRPRAVVRERRRHRQASPTTRPCTSAPA